MAESLKRFRIEFTADAEGWSDEFIKRSAIQELTCMVPYPEDIVFSEVEDKWHTGKPPKKGDYLVAARHYTNDLKAYYVHDVLPYHPRLGWPHGGIVAWQEFDPYKGGEE